ncbi:EIIBC-Fru [Cardiobacterium hominis]|uniref:protein-N(pi)-phosphohistidine--D-fructose phosphotransferase n=1 Tax=Cardiobacterium hominis (strain ATCC 15826 / DSM 8339 / NCTC 10426 / 6573) TaxID=638300 RepID=C8N8C2_CARH6|nr:PTS system fructose-specific EIIBBC component [Cardiobacterium hominis ATCC 15826]VEG77345.1 EIIBC-Fru [Cardiobacterium hominis]
MQLTTSLIRLGATPRDKNEAIRQVAALLAENGKVAPEYVEGMFAREAQENTYLGNGVAIPHGTPQSRHLIKETAIAVLQVPGGIDWEDGEGEPAYLIVGIAASDNEHLAVLKRLSTVVGDEEVAERLAKTTDAEDIRRALSDVAGGESAAPQATASGKYVIGITSCPTGVAHTYMAQEALEKGAQVLGHEVKIETQGSVGADNVLTTEDIARADVVIIAADTNVDPARFVGKRLYRTGTKAAINDAVQVINTAFASAPVFGDADAAASASAKPERTGVYKHLMTGVSHMLPFVVAGGLLIALGFAIGSFMFGEQGIYIYKEEYAGTLGQTLFQIGKDAFALFVPVLGAYIAYSIAGRPGIAPGMVGAYIAANTGAGFLGAIVAGFIAGYFVAWLAKVIKLPRELDSLKPMIILPLVGTAVIGLLMYYLIAHPVADAQSALETWLKSLQGSSALLLGALLGGMMALDMGGPVNKAAYLFSSGLIASDVLGPMAATMAAGMTPPLAICCATMLYRNRFTEEERQAGKAAGVLGLSFITEGAIPFAAKDPLRVIPALMIGSAVTGALSMVFGCGLRAPHGGIFVLFIPNAVVNVWAYAFAIIVGTAVSTACLGVFKKRVSA